MARVYRTTWRHWVDAWLSGLPRGSAEERAAEEMLAAVLQELDHDREDVTQPLRPSRFLGLGGRAGADAAGPAAVLAG